MSSRLYQRSHFSLIIQRLEQICLHLFICNAHFKCEYRNDELPLMLHKLLSVTDVHIFPVRLSPSTWSSVPVRCHEDPASFVWKTGFMEQGLETMNRNPETMRSQAARVTLVQRWNGANTHQLWMDFIQLLPGIHVATFRTTGSRGAWSSSRQRAGLSLGIQRVLLTKTHKSYHLLNTLFSFQLP